MLQKTMLIAASLAVALGSVTPAFAENQMGYSLLTQDAASALPQNHGGLGLVVERAQVMTDSGMTFDIIGVKQVRPGSAGAHAGLKHGDEIIAIDGKVFASLTAFAGYVGSLTPGTQAAVDYIPQGGGPSQAQRLTVTIAPPQGQPASAAPATGMSTGTKVAIGVGAAALLGCYEMGCFKHRPAQPAVARQGQMPYPRTELALHADPTALALAERLGHRLPIRRAMAVIVKRQPAMLESVLAFDVRIGGEPGIAVLDPPGDEGPQHRLRWRPPTNDFTRSATSWSRAAIPSGTRQCSRTSISVTTSSSPSARSWRQNAVNEAGSNGCTICM